jgi:hypothetical protein
MIGFFLLREKMKLVHILNKKSSLILIMIGKIQCLEGRHLKSFLFKGNKLGFLYKRKIISIKLVKNKMFKYNN